MKTQTEQLIERMKTGDRLALARLMTYVDNRHEDLLELMSVVYDLGGNAQKLGVTGPPGAGKSTLVDKIIAAYRKQGKTVGVVAIDPSSPFSGGAVLGDRIRMQDHNADEGVFIRSLGSRGAHGGLSRATRDITQLLDAAGYDIIIIETVGVGQTELDIMAVAHSTLVVLVPESGDTIQTMKAGLMEIADIFVVNKSDREGADKIFVELKTLSEMYSSDWSVPVIKAIAMKGQGVGDIVQVVADHQKYLASGKTKPKFTENVRAHEYLDIATSELREKVLLLSEIKADYKALYQAVLQNKKNPYAAAAELLQKIQMN